MKRTALLIGVAVLVSSAALKAEVYSIKLGGNAQPACWSLEEIVARVTRGIDSDREKVMALHRFGMAHQIHFIGPYEGGLDLQDALKLLSVYGYNLCGNNSSTMCALYNLAGLKARRRGCTGHVVPEIWFDGKWNYVDTDMFGYVYLPDDKAIASVDELVANPHLFERSGRRPDPFYPWDPPTTMMNAFIKVQGWKDYHPYSLAHLMELSLRTGESVTCWFRPQGRTRYYLDPESFPAEVTTVYRDYWTDGPVRQNSMAWTDTVPAAYGNGQFVYKPDLRSRAFQSENPGIEGVKTAVDQDKPPLVAETAGRTATVVIDVNSPWVICGLQNDLTNWEDNTEGAVVSGWFWRIGEADENRIYVSADGGRNWKLAWENRYLGAIPFRVDLSRYVQGNYSYQVKFEWTDRAGSGRVGLQGLEAETWVELSPMALPRLVPGKNRFEISTGNQRAVIKVGTQDVYFEPQTSAVQGATTTIFIPRAVTIGIVLDVLPQIDANGMVMMSINTSISEKAGDRVSSDGRTSVPILDVRESNNVVLSRNGQTIVIGGLMKNKLTKKKSSVPFLGEIPFIGSAFQHDADVDEKTELVIMLTPEIMAGLSVDDQATQAQTSIKQFGYPRDNR